MTVSYPPRLSLSRLPTPLQPLERYSKHLGGPRLWVKRDDMTGSLCTGNKVRKLEFILAHALDNGYNGLVTCGGVQSNHCRATAVLAAELGLHCSLLLRGEATSVADGNLLLSKLAGAQLHYAAPADYVANREQLLLEIQQADKARGIKSLIIPTGGSNGIGIWGYIACAGELQQDFTRLGIAPAAIVHATGSGGTQAGLTLGACLHQLNAAVTGINVCDDEAYFQQKIRSDIGEWQQCYQQASVAAENIKIHVIDGYVGAGYGKAGDEVMHCIAELARLEGVILDPVYTGKAFYGLTEEIRKGRYDNDSDIVFIHTGGIFGLYPYREQLTKQL